MREIKRSYARPRGSFIHIESSICSECGRSRAHYNHHKCSAIRKKRYEELRASHEQGSSLLVPRPDAEADAS